MNETVKCLECNRTYKCIAENTEFSGSIIKTTCPYCNKTISRNISKFFEIQTELIKDRSGGHIMQAKMMIAMAQGINVSINGDNLKKKHKK